MEKQMLRFTLKQLEKSKNLLTCRKEVDPHYELGAVLKYFRNKRPVLFNKVKGSRFRAVGGLYGDRDIMYSLLGINHKNRIGKFAAAIADPQPYRILDKGPIKDNIISKDIDLLRLFPIPKFQEKDSAEFITAGVLVVKDPETENHYTSIRRFQVNGGKQISILIGSTKLTNDFLAAEKVGKDLEVAVILGYDAPFIMASQVSSATYGLDKYEIDSALRQEPLDLVPCQKVDLLVPACSEIVLEGRMVANKRELEGPFGELMGYYGKAAPQPVIEIDAVMHRTDPIFQISFPCREEHLANGLIRETELYYHLNNQVDVIDVNVTEGGGYRFNAFISINKKAAGDGKTAALAALGANRELKQVVIVDGDVDIFDEQDIEWAITTRTQGSKDIAIIAGALGSSLEPSHDLRGVTDKVCIDATKPLGEKAVPFARAVIPAYENIDIRSYFANTE